MGITNNGVFEWNAAKTKMEQNIGDDVEVSLMLWTDNPPQRSYSPTFTMREFNDTIGTKRLARRQVYSPPGSKAYSQCVAYLLDNGGVYNYTEDKNLRLDVNSDGVGTFQDAVSGWKVKVTNTGTTNVTYQAQEIGGGGLKNITVAGMGVNLMQASTQGMGIAALSEIQRMRNKQAETNVVAVYLGSGDVAGHVVMGGHDKALIDQAQGSSVFEKQNFLDGRFEVQLVGITYIPDGLEGRSLEARGTEGVAVSMNTTQLCLSFNSPTIYLPDVILKDLLPHLGAPVYSKELNGYLYEASAKTDYSLRFTLANSTSGNFVNITIPASSLLYRQTTNDNPLTNDLVESGREFLLIAPLGASSGGIGSLGRAFLQHVYIVDDSHLGKFFISAINTTAINEGSSSVIAGSVGLMNRDSAAADPSPGASNLPSRSDVGHNSGSSIVGAVLGSVIGGIAILWLIFLFFYLRQRRARSQLNSQAGDDGADNGEKALEQGIATILGSGGENGVRHVHFHPSRQLYGIAKEVDTPPVATLRGGKQPMSPISLEPGYRGTSMPSPLIISTPSSPRTSFRDKPPPPPAKDEHYFRTIALAHKRFSQPFMKGPHSPLAPPNRKRQSAPGIVLEAMGEGPYTRYFRDNDTEGIQSPTPIPTYQQLLAHHQARRQRASYIDSESSNGNENDANTSNTSSTETATLGKVIAKGQVAKIRQLSSTPPHAALANMLERRASVGRVIAPGEVVIVPPSRRTSRSSRELLQSPRKSSSISPAASSHSAEGTAESVAVGHRRGKSAPSDLGFSLSPPALPPPRAKDDIFISGVRMVGGRQVGRARRAPVPSPPPRRPIEEDEFPTSFLEDATEDGMSSDSSIVMPMGVRLVMRSDSGSSGEKGPSPVSPLSERGDRADYFRREQAQGSIVSPVSPLAPPPFERGLP